MARSGRAPGGRPVTNLLENIFSWCNVLSYTFLQKSPPPYGFETDFSDFSKSVEVKDVKNMRARSPTLGPSKNWRPSTHAPYVQLDPD